MIPNNSIANRYIKQIENGYETTGTAMLIADKIEEEIKQKKPGWKTGGTAITCAKSLMVSHPSDEVILTTKAVKQLVEFREEVMKDNLSDIAGIIFAKTVPLMDFIIVNSDGDKIRFCIFEEALKQLDETPMGSTILIGAMELYDKTPHSVIMFGLVKEKSKFVFSGERIDITGKEIGKITERELELYSDAMYIWHAVQIALLHPYEKEIFANPTKHKVYTREKTKKGKRQRVVRYIRRHTIDEIVMSKVHRERSHHTMVWYVIGHWRHYKNGKVSYVHPYWKGEMREMKMNLDGERNREVVIDSE